MKVGSRRRSEAGEQAAGRNANWREGSPRWPKSIELRARLEACINVKVRNITTCSESLKADCSSGNGVIGRSKVVIRENKLSTRGRSGV